MDTLRFKTRYNPHEPRKFSFSTVGDSMTQQQFKAECDVNNILAKYKKTGLVTHLSKHQGHFGDFSSFEDYQTSLGKVMEAQNSFLLLPSELRSKFHNDPAQLIEYLNDPKNDEEAIKFGLKVRKDVPINMQDAMEKALESNDKKRATKTESKKD